MAYETVTLRGCGDCFPACCEVMPTHSRFSSLGLLPIAAVGLKTAGKAVVSMVVSSLVSGATQYNDPSRVQARVTQQTAYNNLVSSGLLDQTRTSIARSRTSGVGTALDRVMGRWALPGKLPRGLNPVTPSPASPFQPAPLPVITTTAPGPVPVDRSQAYMTVPEAAAGPASGGGVETQPEAAAPVSFNPGPFILGGLALFLFARSRRQR